MLKKLYLDDLRSPPTDEWIVVRSYQEFVKYIEKHGCPNVISFDHDLGYNINKSTEGEMTGYDCAKWLVEQHMDGKITFPENFTFKSHSANPVGRSNILQYLNTYCEKISSS